MESGGVEDVVNQHPRVRRLANTVRTMSSLFYPWLGRSLQHPRAITIFLPRTWLLQTLYRLLSFLVEGVLVMGWYNALTANHMSPQEPSQLLHMMRYCLAFFLLNLVLPTLS